MTRRTLALTSLALVAFAANSLLCRAALGQQLVDAASFTTIRLLAGALALGLIAARRHGRAARGSHGWAAAVALFAYAAAFSLAYVRIPAGIGALALFGAVQVTMIGRGLFTGTRLVPGEWAGLALSIAGLVGLVRPGLAAPDPAGTALMIAAGVAWGVYSLRGRNSAGALIDNAAHFLRAAPLAVALSAIQWRELHVTHEGLLLAVLSGAISSGLGYAVWYAALPGLTPTRAAIVQLAVPPLAAVGAVLFLGESVTARLTACSVAILGGIAVALLSRK